MPERARVFADTHLINVTGRTTDSYAVAPSAWPMTRSYDCTAIQIGDVLGLGETSAGNLLDPSDPEPAAERPDAMLVTATAD